MKTKALLIAVFTLFSLCFGGVSVFMTVLVVRDGQGVRLAQTGRPVEAEAVGMDSSLTVNGVPYYAIEVRFEDENGVHTGWTSESFTYGEARDVLEEGRIELRVDEGYNMIEAGFSGSPFILIAKIFQLVFGAVGLGFLAAIVWQIAGIFRKKRLIRTGERAEAELISAASNTRVNGKPYYYLRLGFTDREGVYREFDTGSLFSFEEKEILRAQKALPVRYGKKAAALDLAALREQGILEEAGCGKRAAQIPERGKAEDGEKE